MKKNYYSARGYWKGESAFEKLANAAGVTEKEAKSFLITQQLWQIYLPPPPVFPRPHFTVRIPNQVHQADLLFLPHDTIKRMVYKYALVVVDIASRYTDAEALSLKETVGVSAAFKKIYTKGRLKWPDTLMVDPGKEFMGVVSTLMKKNNVVIQRSEAGNHITQAFVERANRTVGEKIFSHQYAQELISGGTARKWVGLLRGILNSMNNTPSKIIASTPNEAIGSQLVNLGQKTYDRPIGMEEERLPSVVNVRYLYRAGESEGGEKRRATDAVWSLKIYTLKKTIIEPDQPVLYFLTNGPKRGFVREQLQVVASNSQLPPNTV